LHEEKNRQQLLTAPLTSGLHIVRAGHPPSRYSAPDSENHAQRSERQTDGRYHQGESATDHQQSQSCGD
jgi:hypothetical protein